MKIFIGSDHAGYDLKEKLKAHLSQMGHEVKDHGAISYDPEDDYPDFITLVAKSVAADSKSWGIVLGGSGQGEAMCANRVPGARAMVFYGPQIPKSAVDIEGHMSNDPYEIIKLARVHNDANIISFGIRFLTEDEIKEGIRIFLQTDFSGNERHARRIKKIG